MGVSLAKAHTLAEPDFRKKMNFKNFFHGIARMFTIPSVTRKKLNDNPLAPFVKSTLSTELQTVISSTINTRVTNPTQAAAVINAINHAVDMTGVFN